MKVIIITARITIDDQRPRVEPPSVEDCKLAVENALETPDNDHYGIISVRVEAVEL